MHSDKKGVASSLMGFISKNQKVVLVNTALSV